MAQPGIEQLGAVDALVGADQPVEGALRHRQRYIRPGGDVGDPAEEADAPGIDHAARAAQFHVLEVGEPLKRLLGRVPVVEAEVEPAAEHLDPELGGDLFVDEFAGRAVGGLVHDIDGLTVQTRQLREIGIRDKAGDRPGARADHLDLALHQRLDDLQIREQRAALEQLCRDLAVRSLLHLLEEIAQRDVARRRGRGGEQAAQLQWRRRCRPANERGGERGCKRGRRPDTKAAAGETGRHRWILHVCCAIAAKCTARFGGVKPHIGVKIAGRTAVAISTSPRNCSRQLRSEGGDHMPIPFLMLPPQSDKTRDWGRRIAAANPELEVIVAETKEGAEQAMPLAEAAYGTIPPELLAKAQKLRWLQAPQAAPPAGYYYRELVAHQLAVTNFREIFNDHISAHILAFVLAFARGLHVYIPQQQRREWKKLPNDTGIVHLPEATALVVGVGGIGAEVARLLSAFGVRVLAVDARRTE